MDNKIVCFGAALALGGCYQGFELSGTSERALVVQGISLQGISLQGISLQGISLQGISLQGISLQGISLQGISLQGISLQGSELMGTQEIAGETVEREGTEIIGTEFDLSVDAMDEEGNSVVVPLTLVIDDMYPAPEALTDDIVAYEISYKVKGEDVVGSLCVDEEGVSWPAYIFNGYWDEETGDFIDAPNTISFGCHYGVVAKCSLWGYRPWAEVDDCEVKGKGKKKKTKCKSVALRDFHQACTRMARADYCGNGEPWTEAGTMIDIWDRLSPAIQEREVDWEIEAEWTPDGAWCLNDIRQQGWKAEGLYPACGNSKKQQKKWAKKMKSRERRCGKLKNKGSLLVSSFDLDSWENN